MRLTRLSIISCLALVGSMVMAVAQADSNEAVCQVRKDGTSKQGASGPCTFSQRQGYVDIDLRNGDTVSLSPTGQPNQFRDQNGKRVTRTTSGNTQEYKWDGKRIIVTFGQPVASSGSYSSRSASGEVGQTPPDLVGLRNSSLVGGEIDDAMVQRGYSPVKNEVSGQDVYSYYRSRSDQCVVVRLDKQRRIQSIVYAMQYDCQ